MSKKYPGFRITTIHAITAIGDDDEEGVCAFQTPAGPMPMVAANEERLVLLQTMAQEIADATGRSFKVSRFSVREDIGEIRSKKLS